MEYQLQYKKYNNVVQYLIKCYYFLFTFKLRLCVNNYASFINIRENAISTMLKVPDRFTVFYFSILLRLCGLSIYHVKFLL